MDLELRELLRHYKAEPTWETAYRLLRVNQRITGELLSQKTLRLFTLDILIPIFIGAIDRIHDHLYNAAALPEGYNIYDNIQYSILLHDHEAEVRRGFIPSIGEHPFNLMVNLILEDDLHEAGASLWSRRIESIALGGDLMRVQDTLNNITSDQLRQYLRANFNYATDYLYYGSSGESGPWGYQGVMPLPREVWIGDRNQMNLLLIYSFYPDMELWGELLAREFSDL